MIDHDKTSAIGISAVASDSVTDFLTAPGSAWTGAQHSWLLDALPPTAFSWPESSRYQPEPGHGRPVSYTLRRTRIPG